MIHPSYKELMNKINEENTAEGLPQITSRYSVVLATSKRARELTNGAEPLAQAKSKKALSIAVEEFYEGKVRMNPEGAAEVPAEAEAAEATEAAEAPAEEEADPVEAVDESPAAEETDGSAAAEEE